jgi:hypothetical protein
VPSVSYPTRGQSALDLLHLGKGRQPLAAGELLDERAAAGDAVGEVADRERVAEGRVVGHHGREILSGQKNGGAVDRKTHVPLVVGAGEWLTVGTHNALGRQCDPMRGRKAAESTRCYSPVSYNDGTPTPTLAKGERMVPCSGFTSTPPIENAWALTMASRITHPSVRKSLAGSSPAARTTSLINTQ